MRVDLSETMMARSKYIFKALKELSTQNPIFSKKYSSGIKG